MIGVGIVLVVSLLGCNAENEGTTLVTYSDEIEELVKKEKRIGKKSFDHQFTGSSFPIASTAEKTTTLHHLKTQGNATATVLLEFETLAPPAPEEEMEPDDGCPRVPEVYQCGNSDKPCVYRSQILNMTWVQTYNWKSAMRMVAIPSPLQKLLPMMLKVPLVPTVF